MDVNNIFKLVEALAWPSILGVIIFYFGRPIKAIMISLHDLIKQRGIKVTNHSIEIPSLEREPETIQDLLSYRPHYKELLKTTREELLDQPLSEQQDTDTSVLEQHHQGLIDSVMNSIDSFLSQ